MNKLGVNSARGERERERERKERESYRRGIFGTKDDYWLMLIGKKFEGLNVKIPKKFVLFL